MPARTGWLILAVLLAHVLSLAGGFVYDDHRFIELNRGLQDLSVSEALSDPGRHTADDDRDVYRPLRALSHAFDFARWGPDPFGFHLHSLVLHLLTVLVAAACLRRLLPDSAQTAACFGALVLGVHPLGSEVVAWVSSRGDQQAVLLSLLALWAAGARRRGLALGSAALLAGLATLGKESAAVLPAIAWLHGRCLRDEATRPLQRGSTLALALGVLGALGLRQLALDGGSPIQTLPHGGSFVAQLGWAFYGLGTGALHFVAPTGLSIQYPQEAWAAAGSAWTQLPSWLGLGLVAGFGAALLRRPPRRAGLATFLGGWALLAYLPSSSLLVTLRELVNDRGLYPCLTPLGALAAVLLERALRGQRQTQTRTAILVVLLLALVGLSQRRALDFRDDASLWRSVLRVDPSSATARYGLASADLNAGRVEAALEGLQDAAHVARAGSKPRGEILALFGDLLLRATANPAAARPVLEEALSIQRSWDTVEHPSLAADTTAARLAQCLILLGENSAALELLEREAQRAAQPGALLELRAHLEANPELIHATTRDGS